MSPGLVTCLPGAALTEVATLMAVHQVHAVVVDPGAGRLITARDVIRAALGGATTAEEVLAPEAPSVAPGDTLLAAAVRMVQAREGHVVVRDPADGRVRGVLSSFDVIAVLAGHEPRLARIVRPAPARPAISAGPLSAHVVRDVMHWGIVFCAPVAPLADVARVLVERRTHSVMVWRDGSMAFVTDMDVVAAAVGGGPRPTAGELASASGGLALVPGGRHARSRRIACRRERGRPCGGRRRRWRPGGSPVDAGHRRGPVTAVTRAFVHALAGRPARSREKRFGNERRQRQAT